ncbi:MAG TPA: DUF2178 domain-containing protein [Candidatus Scatomorpha gallistercoris]|nr:DUF2178 domain-containing protein [Candidatus Scatomorpha gallistercoris]
MKKATNKTKLWYLGYAVCAVILLLIAFADFPRMADIGLSCAFGAIFGVSYTQLWYDKQVKKDPDFEIEVEDERNVQIKYRAGYLTCGIDWLLLSAATVAFIILDYTLPAIITGAILLLQPVILVVASNIIEKKI